MISTNTWLENASSKFCVRFDCHPDDVWYGNYKHSASGSERLGIWEGVRLASLKYKDDDGVWRDRSINDPVINIYTTRNDAVMEVEATYEIWTMGYPGRAYPFFFFGNYSGQRKKYQYGYFSDAAPKNPSDLRNSYAKVPSDWELIYSGWAHKGGHSTYDSWSYKHAMQEGGETWNENCYEYRNGTNSSGQNGWTSETGRKPQESRKNCFWIFQKKYRASVRSNGIILNPSVPSIYVVPAKGDGGTVKVTHHSPNGIGSYIKLCSWNTRTGVKSLIADFEHNTWTENNNTKSFYVDFNKHCGGENGRGSDIKYYAWAKTSQGYLSNGQLDPFSIPESQWVGVHRFNGRPSVPMGCKVTGRDNVYYDRTTYSWKSSYDADGDHITYDIWMQVISPEGIKLLDEITVTSLNQLYYDFNMENYPEKSKVIYRVRANDGLITSDWCAPITITKGQGANPADSVYPLNNSTIYNKLPRILIGTGDYEDSENDIVKVKWNGVWYNNKDNPELFSNRPGVSKTIVFKPNVPSNIGENSFSVILNNVYADSKETVIKYNCLDTAYTTSDIDPYIKINSQHLLSMRDETNNVRKAYGLKVASFKELVPQQSIINLQDYKDLANGVNEVNDFVNSFDSNSKFDEIVSIDTNLTYIKDKEWDQIINLIRNI